MATNLYYRYDKENVYIILKKETPYRTPIKIIEQARKNTHTKNEYMTLREK